MTAREAHAAVLLNAHNAFAVRLMPPEPDLTPREMLHRAEAMRQVLRERQPLCY
jgi:hypothetical protein